MDFFRNIQSKPTPILFIKRRSTLIFLHFDALLNAPSLIASVLRVVVVNIGSWVLGNGTLAIAMTASVLRTVVVNIGTFVLGNVAVADIALATSELRTVVINIGTFVMGNGTAGDIAMTASELRLTVRNVGTWSNAAHFEMGMIGSVLA